MKSKSQIEQRISHLKEREKEVDVSLEIQVLLKSLSYFYEYAFWHRIASFAYSDEHNEEQFKEIRILLWILED